jgi:hypothetical protein
MDENLKGKASEAIDYFAKFGLQSPAFSNPSTFFMKCMNAEGLLVESMQKNRDFNIQLTPQIKVEFKERIANMLDFYKASPYFKDIKPAKDLEIPHDTNRNVASWFTQFNLIAKRGLLNEFRNPLDLRTRYFSLVVFSFICCIVFTGVFFFDYLSEFNENLLARRLSTWNSKSNGLSFLFHYGK